MNSKIIVSLVLVILMITTISCITSHDIHVEISCDEFSKNPKSLQNDFQIEIGDKIYVVLCSNPTTGFAWSYEMSGDTALKEEDHDFDPPEGGALGAAGKETWTFEAIEKGSTTINMEYSQLWQGGTKGEWTYTVDVVVK